MLIHFSLPKSVTAWNILRKLCQLYLSRTDQGQVDVLAMFANLYFYADEDLPEIVNVFELLLNFYASSPEKYCMVDHVEILNICEALKIYPKTYL